MTDSNSSTSLLNGVNVEALLDARGALDEAPEAANFTFKAESEWLDGVHARMQMSDFFGLGEEQSRNKAFTVETDHPEVFAATDAAPSPVELVLSALAGCLTAGIASVAENRGIQLRAAKATVEGDMNLYGVLGIDSSVRNGFSAIRVIYDIDADASQEDLEALVAQSQKRSAVFDIITNPTNVSVALS
ncbi:MAG: OsmC family protein [Pseudomonadales bacterium]|nr:OsmC family protein [Pseudomonadales bacterium]